MTTPRDAVIPADPVLDGELIEDDQSGNQLPRWVPSWWQRSPQVPAALKSRTDAMHAAKDAAVSVIRAPWRFVSATGRGAVLAARAWRRWVTCTTTGRLPSCRRSWRISMLRSAS